QVTPDVVGAEPVRRRRALEHAVEILLVGIVRRQQRREHRHQRDGHDHEQSGGGQPMPGERPESRPRTALPHRTRTRGSRWPYRRSTTRLATSPLRAPAMSAPWTRGKPWAKMAPTPTRPSPGPAKTSPTRTEPAMN